MNSGNIGKTPTQWRNFSTKVPLPAVHLKLADLKRIYRILNESLAVYRDRIVAGLSQTSNESTEEFALRREKVFEAFTTSVTITGQNGESTYGNNEEFLEEHNLPELIRSAFFSTKTIPVAVLGMNPLCSVILFVDFDRSPLFDFTRLPTLPTPNESNFEITADDDGWFASSKVKLSEFFLSRQTHRDWVHRAATYDVLLIFLGIPFCLWLSNKVGALFESPAKIPPILMISIYVYGFFLGTTLFRLLFSYSRWVFPKIELESAARHSAFRHRGIWTIIVSGLLVALIYDVLKHFILA